MEGEREERDFPTAGPPPKWPHMTWNSIHVSLVGGRILGQSFIAFPGTLADGWPCREQFKVLHHNTGLDFNYYCIRSMGLIEKNFLKFTIVNLPIHGYPISLHTLKSFIYLTMILVFGIEFLYIFCFIYT